MKILIILIRLSGGVGRANTEIAKSLKKLGHEVDILSREDDLKIFSFSKSIFPLREKIKQLMKEKDYDIIYTQDYSCALPLLLPFPLFWKKHFYCSIGIKKGGVSKFVQDFVGKIMGRKTVVIFDNNKKRFPKAKLIHRGVNLERFKPLRRKRNCLGFMNKFSEQISEERYTKIAKELGLKPLCAGEKKKEKIQRTLKKENKHSFNRIPDSKMNAFYNKCKVFINLATPDAGFNLSWLEAMSAGVPIIVGNNNGAGPILPFDKILNEKDMEKRIKEIIKNPKKINYRKWIIDKGFTWDKKAKELIKFFEKRKNG